MILGHSDPAPLTLNGEARLALWEACGGPMLYALALPFRPAIPAAIYRALAERGECLNKMPLTICPDCEECE